MATTGVSFAAGLGGAATGCAGFAFAFVTLFVRRPPVYPRIAGFVVAGFVVAGFVVAGSCFGGDGTIVSECVT